MKNLIIANWKMKMPLEQSLHYAAKIKKIEFHGLEVVLAPSFPHLFPISAILHKSKIKLAAQNVAAWPAGAYTGEVSAKMLKEVGCVYALIGHSERRQLLNESDNLINEKIKRAFEAGLTPILCVGETLDELKQGKRKQVLINQLKNDLQKIKNFKNIVIAYEPVWAIGTGNFVDPKSLDEVYRIIKGAISMICGSSYYDSKVRLIYGGSVDAKNIKDFAALPFINGFLVGGASLKLSEFEKIARAL